MDNNTVETSRVKIYRDYESVLPFDVFGLDNVPDGVPRVVES